MVIRYAHKEHFVRKLTNGEIVRRDWLIYAPSYGKVFCYVCKLFGSNAGSASEYNNQFTTGFDDWKNATARISAHQKSKDHIAALLMILQCQKSTRIDVELQRRRRNCANTGRKF